MMKKTALTLGVLTSIYLVLLALPPLDKHERSNFYPLNSVHNMAHGAGRGLLPGNSLEAALNSAALGSSVIEIDIHQTRDGVLVVRHDAEIDTTSNGTGLIKEMNYSELQSFDLDFHDKDTKSSVSQNPGNIKIPALKDVFAELPGMRFMIEIKPNDLNTADDFCQLIRATGNAEKLNVVSFHKEVLAQFRRSCPEVSTSLSQNEAFTFIVLSWLNLSHLYSSPGIALQLPLEFDGTKVLSANVIQDAHQLGLAIDAWTIDDADTMRTLIDWGIDGIITNRPDILAEVQRSPIQ